MFGIVYMEYAMEKHAASILPYSQQQQKTRTRTVDKYIFLWKKEENVMRFFVCDAWFQPRL